MQFSTYMHEWLYGVDGYYKNFKAIGKEGDFYTAVSTSSFFGASIANYFFKLLLEDISKRDGWLIEIGAHKGYLICDMIQWLYSCDSSLVKTLKFGIVERQKEVQMAQLEYIHSRFGDDISIVHFDDVKDISVDYAFMVSNEIFDAFSCELYKDEKIAIVENDEIKWIEAPVEMKTFALKYRLKTGEIAVGYEAFAKDIARGVKRCDFVSFDYGEKLVRNDFSIRTYEKHKTFPLFDKELSLKNAFKKSDITYDVNFNHLIDAFEEADFKTVIYETQARALIRFGLIDILEQFSKVASQSSYIREVDKIKTLIAPTIMGDKFKMVHFKN